MGEKCKICGKGPFSRIDTHLRQSHDLTKKEYDAKFEQDDELEELDDNENKPIENVSTNQSRTDTIFEGAKTDYPRDLDGFLDHFKITEKDLLSLVKRFTEGKSIDVTKTIQNNMNSAEIQAKRLVEEQGDKIKTRNLYVAEILTTKYDYKCLTVTSNPKEWVLSKTI